VRHQVIPIYRADLLESSLYRNMGATERGAYLHSWSVLADASRSGPYQGCLRTGTMPMTIEQWRREVEIDRIDKARAIWEWFHTVGLFEMHHVNSFEFCRIVGFRESLNRFWHKKCQMSEQTCDSVDAVAVAGQKSGNTRLRSRQNKSLGRRSCEPRSEHARNMSEAGTVVDTTVDTLQTCGGIGSLTSLTDHDENIRLNRFVNTGNRGPCSGVAGPGVGNGAADQSIETRETRGNEGYVGWHPPGPTPGGIRNEKTTKRDCYVQPTPGPATPEHGPTPVRESIERAVNNLLSTRHPETDHYIRRIERVTEDYTSRPTWELIVSKLLTHEQGRSVMERIIDDVDQAKRRPRNPVSRPGAYLQTVAIERAERLGIQICVTRKSPVL